HPDTGFERRQDLPVADGALLKKDPVDKGDDAGAFLRGVGQVAPCCGGVEKSGREDGLRDCPFTAWAQEYGDLLRHGTVPPYVPGPWHRPRGPARPPLPLGH